MPQRSYELLQLVSFYILTETKKNPVDCCDFSLISLLSYLMSWRNKFVADLNFSLWFTETIVRFSLPSNLMRWRNHKQVLMKYTPSNFMYFSFIGSWCGLLHAIIANVSLIDSVISWLFTTSDLSFLYALYTLF
jgi:hypothetical protein